jgi:integrase
MKAKITGYVRPFHDGRHTSITNSAAAGMEPMKMMKRAGHADLSTTMLYVDLAGETFPEAAEMLEARLLGQKSGQT